jgi:uncharacterized protein (TIGR03083 family)
VDHVSLVNAVREEGEAVLSGLASDPAMDTPVPTCTPWTLSDLVVHLGAFCGFWSHILCEGTGRPLTPYPDPPAGAALVPWLSQLHVHLVAELEATPATTEVWTWFAADHTAAFVARRCAHELAIHRYDAESAHGTSEPIPTALAVDGIEEILGALVTARNRTGAGKGRGLSLRCTDAPVAWSVVMEPDRIDAERTDDREAAPEGDLTVTGTASDLELTLYHRPTISPVDVIGDYSVLEEWHREFQF